MTAAALLLAAAVAAASPRAQLDLLEARRRAEETAARMLAQQERSILDTLHEAETAVVQARAEWKRVDAERSEAEARLHHARDAEGAAQARMSARLAELRPRLLARARMGRTGELQLLLAARSLADLVKRRYLLDVVLSRDLALLGEAHAALVERERARAERELEAGRLQVLAVDVEDRRAQAVARREERETLIAALRSARTFHERAAAEASAQARKLAEFVATLPPPRTARQAGGFEERRGKLPFPAAGPITVGFGKVVNPKFNTVTVQNGIDIKAPAGAPARAVAPGRVVHAGWFKGYGNLVIVDHGGGYHTLIAHLASMKTAMGEDVDAGDVLGTVGDSGSLTGTCLYFEIREKGRPVDPRPWLGR
jgi:septal ring factor EnvC (AmiA/AmiB activator)